MWNRTSYAYSKHGNASVSNVRQNSSVSSALGSVKPRSGCAASGGTRCNGSENAPEPLKNTGSAAESAVFYRKKVAPTTGIAKILRYNAHRSKAFRTTQRATHQLFKPLLTVEKQQARSGQSELKILVSVVRFRPRPPLYRA